MVGEAPHPHQASADHGMPAVRLALALGAILSGIAVAWIMLTNGVRPPHALDLILVPLVGWSFALSGLVSWSIRKDNPIGPAIVLTGLLWFASALYWSQEPVVFSIGHAFESFYLAGVVYVLLTFPTGRLDSRRTLLLAVVVLLAPARPRSPSCCWADTPRAAHAGGVLPSCSRWPVPASSLVASRWSST